MGRLAVLFLGLAGLALGTACGGAQGIPVYFQSDRDGQWEIYSIWHDGTNLTRLTNNSTDDTTPEVSHDGSKLAFLRTEGGVTDVWVIDVTPIGALKEGATEQNVTKGQVQGQIGFASWYPDGRRLVLSISRPEVAEGRAQVYRLNLDGSDLTRVSQRDDFMYLVPRIHPLGGQVTAAVGPSEDSLDVFLLETSDGKFIRNVPRESFRALQRGFDEKGVTELYGDFDGTGRSLVFQTNVTGDWDIFSVEGDGRKPTNLTDSKGVNETQPSWGGALERLWYVYVSDRDGNPEIYIANIGTGAATRLTNNPAQDIHPSWLKTPKE